MTLTPLQFAHANGFPSESYQYFLDLLKKTNNYSIGAISKIGHNPAFPVTNNWPKLTDELLQHLKNNGAEQKPIIGIGHSLGGVLMLLAALRRPDYFRQLILMEPVVLSYTKRKIVGLLRPLGLMDYLSPAQKSKKRRTQFPDRQAAYTYFKGKKLFENFDPNCFQNYIEHGLQDNPNGSLELAFSSKIETQIFRTFPTTLPKLPLKVPTKMLYSPKGIFDRRDISWWQKKWPAVQLIPFEKGGGHLFPLEKPAETAHLINSLIHT